MRRTRWLIATASLVVLVGVTLVVVLSQGYFWSFRETAFRRLLESLPEPLGWVPDTDLLATNAYSYYGFRYYDVNGRYAEVVDFFKVELPRLGWKLSMEAENARDPQHSDYIQSVSLLFTYQERYCLVISLGADEQDIQLDGRIWVHMTISEETDCSLR